MELNSVLNHPLHRVRCVGKIEIILNRFPLVFSLFFFLIISHSIAVAFAVFQVEMSQFSTLKIPEYEEVEIEMKRTHNNKIVARSCFHFSFFFLVGLF